MKTLMPSRKLESALWARGYTTVAGVDEVGRGPLAGPLTVGAVILPTRCRLSGLRDSKQLTEVQRQRFAMKVRRVAIRVGVGWATSSEIDELGLTAALRLAAGRALSQLPDCEFVVLDGKHDYLAGTHPVATVVKADQSCLAVAAASVVAKVARDNYMRLLDQLHPEYGFAQNKGYGSAGHLAALQLHGPSRFHRLSFGSVGVGVER